MAAHNRGKVTGSVTPEELDKLAELLSRLPEDRKEKLMDDLETETIAEQLRTAITASGLTHYAIGKAAGVAPQVIARFARGERDIRLETAANIAKALGYELRPIASKRGR